MDAGTAISYHFHQLEAIVHASGGSWDKSVAQVTRLSYDLVRTPLILSDVDAI